MDGRTDGKTCTLSAYVGKFSPTTTQNFANGTLPPSLKVVRSSARYLEKNIYHALTAPEHLL